MVYDGLAGNSGPLPQRIFAAEWNCGLLPE
jgi:hypothetical protein